MAFFRSDGAFFRSDWDLLRKKVEVNCVEKKWWSIFAADNVDDEKPCAALPPFLRAQFCCDRPSLLQQSVDEWKCWSRWQCVLSRICENTLSTKADRKQNWRSLCGIQPDARRTLMILSGKSLVRTCDQLEIRNNWGRRHISIGGLHFLRKFNLKNLQYRKIRMTVAGHYIGIADILVFKCLNLGSQGFEKLLDTIHSRPSIDNPHRGVGYQFFDDSQNPKNGAFIWAV